MTRLCICLFLFMFRVVAQWVQQYYLVSFLPPFEKWYSGVTPYPQLLASQVVIIAALLLVIILFIKGKPAPKHKLGIGLLIWGGTYFSVMLFRFIAGLTFAADNVWMNAPIPAVFHLVLAAFLLLLGKFHYTYGK